MRFRASRSIPGAIGLTVALETIDGVGETDVGKTRCVTSVEVRERYSPDERGDCDMGVRGRALEEGELDGDDGIEDDGGEEDMEVGVDEIGEDVSWVNGGSYPIKLSSE